MKVLTVRERVGRTVNFLEEPTTRDKVLARPITRPDHLVIIAEWNEAGLITLSAPSVMFKGGTAAHHAHKIVIIGALNGPLSPSHNGRSPGLYCNC